jgi:hypothetical protein
MAPAWQCDFWRKLARSQFDLNALAVNLNGIYGKAVQNQICTMKSAAHLLILDSISKYVFQNSSKYRSEPPFEPCSNLALPVLNGALWRIDMVLSSVRRQTADRGDHIDRQKTGNPMHRAIGTPMRTRSENPRMKPAMVTMLAISTKNVTLPI